MLSFIISLILFILQTMALCDCPVGAPIGPTLASTCGGGQFMLFMGLLEVFLRSQCDLEDPCNRPKVSKWRANFFCFVINVNVFYSYFAIDSVRSRQRVRLHHNRRWFRWVGCRVKIIRGATLASFTYRSRFVSFKIYRRPNFFDNSIR